MNIFIHELKSNIKSLLIWSVIIGLLIVIAVAKFSGFADNPEMLSLFDSMPDAVIQVMQVEVFNLTTLTGFFGLMFLYFSLMGAMAAVLWGTGIISKEERDKTVEFSLVLPVSRNHVITFKALAALIYCVAYVLITWGIALVLVRTYQPDPAFYKFLTLEMLAMFLIEIIFLSVGLLLGCSMKQYKLAGSAGVAFILGTYFLSILIDLTDKTRFLRVFSPFKYFNVGELYNTGRFEGIYLFLTAGIVIICLAVAYFMYNRRDLYI